MNSPLATGTRSYRRFHPAPGARSRLVCFPHAGGAAGTYTALSKELAPDTEVLGVQYPGRQDRAAEKGVGDIHELAAGVVEELVPLLDDRPLALFGHSMGALVAYETARLLEHEHGAPAAMLFASGRRAPSRRREGERKIHLKDDQGLVEELRALGGTDERLLAEPALLEVILPPVRADYRAVETYRHRPGPEPRCPFTVLVGDEDPRTTMEEVDDWRLHTDGACTVEVFPGGHFFVLDRTQEIAALVSARLRGLAPTA
ncbi:thioesterase II family protein [Streptomyces tsukubensis]|uniref:Thioesterase TesA-like domain-containing protein n=1 Tax=Streptomyces tsukubensis TaxID=83656 RepID=A0A1V4A267_9ACTN|nr:alpha/beta fold hydrolase [Streptomyces tsukubensis]OON73467.1 hypothetical protein B1H18_27175 [Streptomyces tsukubensis]